MKLVAAIVELLKEILTRPLHHRKRSYCYGRKATIIAAVAVEVAIIILLLLALLLMTIASIIIGAIAVEAMMKVILV